MFIDGAPVPVSLDGKNTIYIRAKMDFGTKQRVMSAMGRGRDIDLGAYQMALMEHNIVKWEGPAFAGHLCTAENIAKLDPDEPLVQKVLDEISERNSKKSPLAETPVTGAGEQS